MTEEEYLLKTFGLQVDDVVSYVVPGTFNELNKGKITDFIYHGNPFNGKQDVSVLIDTCDDYVRLLVNEYKTGRVTKIN